VKEALIVRSVIVIVNSRFLLAPTKSELQEPDYSQVRWGAASFRVL